MTRAIGWRVAVVVPLLIIATTLLRLDTPTERTSGPSTAKSDEGRPLLDRIDAVVDTLFRRYQIDGKGVKSWSVLTPDKRFIRKERRVFVPPQFISLDFNHDLSRLLSDVGVRVVATERTKESTVAMHLISNGMVIETITFVLKREKE